MEYNDRVKRNGWASKPQIRKYDSIYNGKLRIIFDNGEYIRDTGKKNWKTGWEICSCVCTKIRRRPGYKESVWKRNGANGKKKPDGRQKSRSEKKMKSEGRGNC